MLFQGIEEGITDVHVHANLIVLVKLLADDEFIGECNHFLKSEK